MPIKISIKNDNWFRQHLDRICTVETVRRSGIFNNHSTSACWIWVGYNHLISEIIVLLKTPAKYREFFPTLFVKTTDFQLVFKFEQTRTVTLISSLVTPPLPTFLESTLEIELELHKWEASARSQLLHSCSLLLSNCKIISTLIITLECNNYMLHCNNWYSKMKLNNFIIPLYCCDSKSNFCAGFFFALKWNKLQWAGYLVESMTSVSGVNMHHWSVNLCGKCNGCAFINECNKTNSILKKPRAQPCFMWTVCNVKGTHTVVLSSTSYET